MMKVKLNGVKPHLFTKKEDIIIFLLIGLDAVMVKIQPMKYIWDVPMK